MEITMEKSIKEVSAADFSSLKFKEPTPARFNVRFPEGNVSVVRGLKGRLRISKIDFPLAEDDLGRLQTIFTNINPSTKRRSSEDDSFPKSSVVSDGFQRNLAVLQET